VGKDKVKGIQILIVPKSKAGTSAEAKDSTARKEARLVIGVQVEAAEQSRSNISRQTPTQSRGVAGAAGRGRGMIYVGASSPSSLRTNS